MSEAIRISIVGTEPGMGIVHRQVIAAFGNYGLVCPRCGSEDAVGAWADDGEADLADWWECTSCGATGAFLHPQLPGVTRNGVALMGYSRLEGTPSGTGST